MLFTSCACSIVMVSLGLTLVGLAFQATEFLFYGFLLFLLPSMLVEGCGHCHYCFILALASRRPFNKQSIQARIVKGFTRSTSMVRSVRFLVVACLRRSFVILHLRALQGLNTSFFWFWFSLDYHLLVRFPIPTPQLLEWPRAARKLWGGS
mmetsp:Transcript_6025/g.13984  ORF Transcript_6025/g.13984 Transcript_6025/m.13984 type:complete len:151 (+) Transcript_6025:316-768(+)